MMQLKLVCSILAFALVESQLTDPIPCGSVILSAANRTTFTLIAQYKLPTVDPANCSTGSIFGIPFKICGAVQQIASIKDDDFTGKNCQSIFDAVCNTCANLKNLTSTYVSTTTGKNMSCCRAFGVYPTSKSCAENSYGSAWTAIYSTKGCTSSSSESATSSGTSYNGDSDKVVTVSLLVQYSGNTSSTTTAYLDLGIMSKGPGTCITQLQLENDTFRCSNMVNAASGGTSLLVACSLSLAVALFAK